MATRKKAKAGIKAKAKTKGRATAKAATKKVVKLKTKKPVAKAKAAPKKVATPGRRAGEMSELPPPSTKPFGQAGKALDGVRILDFTHVQSGPTCTQLLGYMGADCIKVERPGVGDITRGQLRDVKGADSLYFTMLNGNKRSITINSKHPKGKEILERLIKHCDVLVENFAPGALDRMGLTWEYIHKTNPRMIVASVKGFGPGPYEDCKVYENVAQCAGGAASTTGFREGPPLVTGAQIGNSGTGLHLAFGIVTALYQRMRTGRGQRVLCAMQDGVLNLARVKLRDQQRLTHGPLSEYSQYGEGVPFGKAVPRAGNDSGGGQPGWILKCKGWETDPDAYIYFITQAPGVGGDLRPHRQARVEDRSGLRQAASAAATAQAHLQHHRAVDHDQDQVRGHGHLQQARHSGRPDPVHEGDCRGAVAARDRHRGRGRSPGPRQVSDRREPGEDVGLDHRGETRAAARRAHRGNPHQGARLFCGRACRDQSLRRDLAASQEGSGSRVSTS